MAIYVTLCMRGLHALELVSSQFFLGHSSFSTLTESSKSISFLAPAIILTIATVGLEECNQVVGAHENTVLDPALCICKLFLTDSPLKPAEDLERQQRFGETVMLYLPVIGLVVFGIIALFCSRFHTLSQFADRVKRFFQTDRVKFENQDHIVKEALSLVRMRLFDDIENRYFDISESRRESLVNEIYDGPKDENYSRPDEVSSIKVSDRLLPEFDKKRIRVKEKVKVIMEMVNSLKASKVSLVRVRQDSSIQTAKSSFLSFTTSQFDKANCEPSLIQKD